MDQAPVASRAMPLETRRHRDDPARLVSVSFFERDLVGFSGNARSSRSLRRTPRSSRSRACIACKVRSSCAATSASSQAASSSLIRVLVAPPIGLAAAVPVSSQRRRQFTTVETLTRKTGGCRPAARTRLNGCDHTLPQILRIGSSHPCWPPSISTEHESQITFKGTPIPVFAARKWSSILFGWITSP